MLKTKKLKMSRGDMGMLTQERYHIILQQLHDKRTVTVAELTQALDTSESTIRRDLNTLHEMGKLIKVHGGATVLSDNFSAVEDDVRTKAAQNVEAKRKIARYAATLIHENDFVFIDAGTTTEKLVDYLEHTGAVFVTNGIAHAKRMVQKGLKVYLIGGQLKLSTEAIVGTVAVQNLRQYNFTKCFLGSNGVSLESGFTTPDPEEALLKAEVVGRSYQVFLLADSSKFGRVTSVCFARLGQATIITDRLPDEAYREQTVVKEVGAE